MWFLDKRSVGEERSVAIWRTTGDGNGCFLFSLAFKVIVVPLFFQASTFGPQNQAQLSLVVTIFFANGPCLVQAQRPLLYSSRIFILTGFFSLGMLLIYLSHCNIRGLFFILL